MSRSRRGSTQLANVDLCERMWAFENIDGLVPLRSKRALVRGSLIHTGLSYWWAHQMTPPPDWFFEKSLQERLEEEGAGHPSIIGQALNVTHCYAGAYKAPDPQWEPLYVEHEFRACGDWLTGRPQDEGEILTAKPDLIVRERDTGRALMVDHKSGAPKGTEYDLSWQFSYYRLVLEACGVEVDGVVVQTIKANPAGTDCAFDRIEAPANRQLDDEIRDTLRHRIQREAELREGRTPKANFGPQTCFGRWGECSYRPICQAAPGVTRQGVIDTYYRKETP